MARKRSQPITPPKENGGAELFTGSRSRQGRVLFLARFLANDAESMHLRGDAQDRAHQIITKWIDLQRQGVLDEKETALDAGFLHEVFGDALGYATVTQSPEDYQLARNFTVSGVGVADGALGMFRSRAPASPAAVIELKGAKINLDRDRSSGRTPVQQCWDYLNALPDCPWGIVSNFVTFRLYHRNKTPLVYEEFALQELRDPKRFRQFYYLFERGGLLGTRLHPTPRALDLLTRTENRQRAVGDELYGLYSQNRYQLIAHLHYKLSKPLDLSIHIAQKLLDRIVFVAFCEDRGLLPPKCIDDAYNTLPPFSKVTNPRWQNFIDLFQAIDRGHARFNLETGYNGGLFRHDPEVDDLQLDDDHTQFFRTIATYDFRDEVNVDVLGHIFEHSVTELEKLRLGGLLGTAETEESKNASGTAMKKSAERKRHGIYYTPPEFTRFIVDSTLGAVIKQRFDRLRKKHRLSASDLDADRASPAQSPYWQDCWHALANLKICDPACGSGAFLIRAYELLEERYYHVAQQRALHENLELEDLAEEIPDLILNNNLFGVDLNPQAVEITQLALWIRSARRNKTLADLSNNIVCGNSLVSNPAVDDHALNWRKQFPGVFARDNPGFDCVIGNPPWERMKLQEREFFSRTDAKIAQAVSAADRRRLIEKLEKSNPDLHERYVAAKNAAEKNLQYVRACGDFPLTAQGDINTYAVFAELAHKIVAPEGRVGLLVPSGIATDNTTKEFFAELMQSQSLVSLNDFENRKGIFPDIDSRMKFCILVFAGPATKTPAADFLFFAHRIEDLDEEPRHIALSSTDLALLNPNTRTCPIFRSRRDAELTKAIYRRVPILIDESRSSGGNPWGVKFVTMFHQTNDAELFLARPKLVELGAKQQGNRWTKAKRTFLPLYEAKMIQAYDHRAASVIVDEANWVRQGQPEATTLVGHQNPEFVVQPRFWVDEAEVTRITDDNQPAGFIGFKDITSPTNQRTMIAAAIPWSAVTNHFPLIKTATSSRQQCCLLANLNSFVLDYAARQKIGGVTLNFFIVNQFPIFPPDRYAEKCPWNKRQSLQRWISDRVLKLTCTANDMRPLAEAAGFDPPVHKWNPKVRAELIAELDAAFFMLYGLDRDDVEYILGTFQAVDDAPEGALGLTSVKHLVLDAYDRLVAASRS